MGAVLRSSFALAVALLLTWTAVSASAAPVILNEYNGVREDKPLKNGGSDPVLGTPPGTPVFGNGSLGAPVGEQNDWFEL